MGSRVWSLTLSFFMLFSLFIPVKAVDTATDLDKATTRPVQVEEASWPMAGANPQRTSWTPEEVGGPLGAVWYKPFEPYISQKVQIIAAYQTLYIATARGLYALDAATGAQRWVFPTALPLGNSPTLADGVAYVGGLDHRLYALDAFSGQLRWSFEGGAGFQTSPLVVGGVVYAGNRDGVFYAIHAQGERAGQLAWRYATGGAVLFSAAYQDGVVYFASQDSHAYALAAQTGALVWRSAKLPGAGFHSWWPVVYRDRVILAGSRNYPSSRFSTGSKTPVLEWSDVYPNSQLDPADTFVGPLGAEPGDWAPGTRTLDASRPTVTPNGQTTPITEYLEAKPWRRTYFVLDRATGQEVTYDFDRDGRPEYAPVLWFGTHSGNRYPPVVGGDGVLYQSNNFLSDPFIPWGHITGWKLDTPFISLPAPGRNAVDEPQGYAAGGSLLYWNRCCDRVGAAFDLDHPGTGWTYFSYDLEQQLPGYNQRFFNPDTGYYTAVYAAFGGPNGVYGFHADTNPPIPYQGRVYMHRSNAVIAFAPGGSGAPTALPLAESVPAAPSGLTRWGPSGLAARLAGDLQAMLAGGHLRPGYASHGHFDPPAQYQCGDDLVDYFHHPAETIVTLIQALPHLPAGMQPAVRAYLQAEFTAYPPHQVNHTGWAAGAAREAFDLPPEIAAVLGEFPPEPGLLGFVWGMNPYSFYAVWQYAAIMGDPQVAQQLLSEAKNNRLLMGSFSAVPENGVLARMPLVHNAYIAGYLGYLGLEQLAGQPESGPVRQELDRLLALRASQFSKDSAYGMATTRAAGAYCRTLNVASNFMFLTPELAAYLREHALAKVQDALAEYESLAPHWFVSFAEEGFGENAFNPLYDGQALFLAKAWILREDGAELERYLDVPAFARGDLFYIQKLVAAIENYGQVNLTQLYLPMISGTNP